MVQFQRLNIQQIDNELTIILLKMGKPKIMDDYQNLIHIIDLKDYVSNSEKIRETLNLFEQDTSIEDSLKTTRLKLDQLTDKINNLLPFKRQK